MLADKPLIAALNHLIDQSGWARARLKAHAGKRLKLALFPLDLPLTISEGGRFVATGSEAVPDVEITLPANAPLLLPFGIERIMARVRIAGQADLADDLGFVLRNLRWDAEEDLSRLIGDIAAHRVAEGVRGAAAWQQQAWRNLSENLAEYFGEETKTLVARRELTNFADELAETQRRITALEQRLARLGR